MAPPEWFCEISRWDGCDPANLSHRFAKESRRELRSHRWGAESRSLTTKPPGGLGNWPIRLKVLGPFWSFIPRKCPVPPIAPPKSFCEPALKWDMLCPAKLSHRYAKVSRPTLGQSAERGHQVRASSLRSSACPSSKESVPSHPRPACCETEYQLLPCRGVGSPI